MKRTYKSVLWSALLLAALAIQPLPALSGVPGVQESLPAWSQVASTFAIDPFSQDHFVVNANSLLFREGKTSENAGMKGVYPIVARCPVINPLDGGNPKWNALILDYVDPDGMSNDYRVQAKLYRVRRADGGVFLVAQFDSNGWSDLTTRQEGAQFFNHSWNFLRNDYFIELNLRRRNTSANPVINAVRLTEATTVGTSGE